MMRLVKRANQVVKGDRIVSEEGVVTVTEAVHDETISILYYDKLPGEEHAALGNNYECSVVAWPDEFVDILL